MTNVICDSCGYFKKNAELLERNKSLNNRDIRLCRIANDIRDENFILKQIRDELDCAVTQLREDKSDLEDENEALKAELKEVCDVLIRKCPEMKEWVMMNWKNLYEVDND